jgi:hypothetical protein
MPGETINLVHDDGTAITVSVDEAAGLVAGGRYHVERGADVAGRTLAASNEERYGGVSGTLKAAALGGLRTVSGGLTDVLASEDEQREYAGLREHNPGASLVGEIAGGILPVGASGLASRIGAKVAGKGGGAVAQIARSGVSNAVEGGIQGVGSAVSELALSDDPLTFERAASVIGSNALFGGVTGGAVGLAGKVVERGLVRAKSALDEAAGAGVGRLGEVSDDLAKLDRKGLRAAETAENEAIEAARVPKRAELADEIKSFRQELKQQKLWLATKGSDDVEIRAIGKRTLKADRALDNVLDDPKALAENPKAALSNLRKQEAALDELVNKHGPKLREKFAGEESGDRLRSLDFAQTALERNRSLQAKITDLSSKPASERLTKIAEATEAPSAPKPPPSLAQDLLGGSVFGHVAGAFSGLPIVGPMIGAKAASLASRLVGGKLGAASTEAAARASKAVGAFLDVGRRVGPSAPVLATKVLSSVRYAPDRDEQPTTPGPSRPLAKAYKARSEEIRSLTQPTVDGGVQMRPAARAEMAAKLAPIGAVSPLLADRIESTKARGVEFLASKMPRRPDVAGIPVGPDNWQPSDMEMRTWARYVAAVEDPHGVVERLASGAITPEDVEAITQVYPELHADITRQIVEQLPTLRAQLPYQRRLALSMFSGVAVDPALDSAMLRTLQSTFMDEPGSEGGTEAPKPQPAFGSIKAEDATPAQERAG